MTARARGAPRATKRRSQAVQGSPAITVGEHTRATRDALAGQPPPRTKPALLAPVTPLTCPGYIA